MSVEGNKVTKRKRAVKKVTRKQKPKCGLCGSSTKELMKTECCKNWICDDEEEYDLSTSIYRNSCTRNHYRYTLCFYHYNEDHKGKRWQDCQKCKDDFDTPNYVLFGTEHNFEPLENPPKYSISCYRCGFTSDTIENYFKSSDGYSCRKACAKA